jgi:ketosteroid isomerase-like protein
MSAPAQHPDAAAALQEMVATERAFSQASADKGTRESFLEFIADDGILFRPNAVKGKQWMLSNKPQPTTKRTLLSWQPVVAAVAQSGEMGYTTGPWQFKQDINDDKPVGFGDFITVWKKQADGTWKFAVDLGISHSQPTGADEGFRALSGKTSKGATKLDAGAERSALLTLEREFADAAAKQGAEKAFALYAWESARVFREGQQPFVGVKAARAALAKSESVWSWQPQFADVSNSGDLGYSYGLYELRTSEEGHGLVEKGNYLRIWQKQNGAWKVVVDVANPMPDK